MQSVSPSRYRWVVLAVVWAAYLNVYLTRLSVGPLAPFLKDAFGLSNAQVGSLVTAASVLYSPATLVAGWLVDRLEVRRMLVVGSAGIGICVIALFFAPSYQAMLIIFLASGLATGCIFPATVKAIITWFPASERATVLGLNQTSVNVSGIIGGALLPTIAITLGWRYGFLFVGFCAILICFSSLIFYRRPPREIAGLVSSVVPRRASGPSATQLTIRMFKSRDIWVLSLASLFFAAVEFAVLTNLVLYLKEGLAFGIVAAGGLLAVTQAAGAFGKPASGFVSDRLLGGRRKTAFMIMGGTASAMCLALAIGGRDLGWLLYPVLAILGVSAIGWGGLYATMAGELGGKELAGAASGATSAILVLGSIAGPPGFGFIVDRTGSYFMAWLAMAFCAAVSVALASFMREHHGES